MPTDLFYDVGKSSAALDEDIPTDTLVDMNTVKRYCSCMIRRVECYGVGISVRQSFFIRGLCRRRRCHVIFNIDISPCMCLVCVPSGYMVCVHGECILCVCMVFVTCVCLMYTWSCEFMFVLCVCLVMCCVCVRA